MSVVATIAVALVALLHVWVLVMEMFLWTTARVRATFGTTAEFAAASKVMAGNQGLYNGFLAAGLIWALLAPEDLGVPVAYFFLGCVAVAGVYGGLTVSRRIIVVQTVPALIAIGLVRLG